MLNTVYRLIAPRRFEMALTDLDLFSGHVLVRPTHLSICNADQRYYLGTRDAEVLAQKLPMALIHEGVGDVVFDPTGTFKPGDSVVMIPNEPTTSDEYIAENYLTSSKFAGSSKDGFLQEYVSLTPDRLVLLPQKMHRSVAAITEIVSVSVHAITRFDQIAHKRREKIGIWGDGNLSYITALFIKKQFPDTKVYVFGVVADKLSDFTFVDGTYLTTKIPKDLQLDHVFECVGGNGSPIAIEQMIAQVKPEGTMAILGVSEYPIAINTRMILEKGLRVFGSSRSGREDFVKTVELYKAHNDIAEYLMNLIGLETRVRNIKDIQNAFEADAKKMFGKTILIWDE